MRLLVVYLYALGALMTWANVINLEYSLPETRKLRIPIAIGVSATWAASVPILLVGGLATVAWESYHEKPV